MRASTLVGIFFPLTSALLGSRAVNDPGARYLSRMCLPEYTNDTRSSANSRVSRLALSEFPCEQSLYIQSVCIAKGTEPIDFLAEQQCFCNGGYFHASEGCNACYVAHGEVLPGDKPLEILKSSLSSIKMLECSTGPATQPFTNLFPPINITSVQLRPAVTLAPDPFLNDTAVSNYFTPTTLIAPGIISGSATARATSWTNYSGVRYTPPGTPSSGNSTQTPVKSTSTSATTSPLTASPPTTPPPSSNAGNAPGVSAATTTATSASGNGAGSLKGQSAAGGLLAAMVGVMVLL